MNHKICFDYSALEGKIKQYYGTQEKFAMAISMSRSKLNQVLQNKSDFTSRKIQTICKLLDINNSEIPEYFFKPKSSEK